MNAWLDLFNNDIGAATPEGIQGILLIALMSFAVGHLVGFVYMWTHETVSYSRSFVASLAVMPVLVAIMMLVMAGSVVVAFGLLAVFGVIRFRNVLKDTRDTTFLLWSIMEGLAVGTQRYSLALLGAACVALILLYLRWTSFGSRTRYDAVLTFHVADETGGSQGALQRILKRHTLRTYLVSQRRVLDGVDLSYQVLLRDPRRADEFQTSLGNVPGLENVAVFMHDDEAEI